MPLQPRNHLGLQRDADYPLCVSGFEIGQKTYMTQINDNFAGMFEIDRGTPADDGLHLAQPPVGLLGMAHHHARFQKRNHPTPFGTRP